MIATLGRGSRAGGALVLAAAGVLGAYVAVRAWVLSFTHDESFTYTREVHESLTWILFSERRDANNHPLNTLAMKLADVLFGPSEIALRSLSVAAFFVYAASLILILRRVERWPIRVVGLSLALANPYVLDFFSLARGYGLALAMVAASMLATIEYVERPRLRVALAAFALAGLAVLANYATLSYYVAVLLVVALTHSVRRPQRPRTISLWSLGVVAALATVGVALLAVFPLFRLRSAGALYFGGDQGFWQDTAHGLVASTLYRRDSGILDNVLVTLVVALVIAGAVGAAIALWRRHLPPHVTVFALLVTAGVVSVVQHLVLDVPYLIERTALFFVPLFAVWLAFATDALARSTRLSRGLVVAGTATVACVSLNFATAANISYTLDWRYDASTEHMVRELGRLRGTRTVRLGASWLFEPTINFYRETRRLAWLGPLPYSCRSECIAPGMDYYFVIGPDTEMVTRRGGRTVRAYLETGGVLTEAAPPVAASAGEVPVNVVRRRAPLMPQTSATDP